MTTNLLKGLLNIQSYGDNDLNKIVMVKDDPTPIVNKRGNPLDFFVRDALCNSFTIKNPKTKMDIYLKEFSHFGDQNNPPDIMIKGDDALEVKKVEKFGGGSIALNSSYPKNKLHKSDSMLTEKCRMSERWDEKDIIYCIGHVFRNKLKILIFIYGDCYAAKPSFYKKIRESIILGLGKLKLNLSKTKELARLNKFDPLGITDLRVRGMFQIKSPIKLFSDFIIPDLEKHLSVFAIMKKSKFDQFNREDKENIQNSMNLSDIRIKNPDNPEELMDAKLIDFSI